MVYGSGRVGSRFPWVWSQNLDPRATLIYDVYAVALSVLVMGLSAVFTLHIARSQRRHSVEPNRQFPVARDEPRRFHDTVLT